MRFLPALLTLFLSLIASFGQEAKEGNAGDAQKLVTIRRILVEGTRVSPHSIIRLAQIKAGDQVNFLTLRESMQKVTKTGLVENIDFEYESLPEKEAEVVLHIKCKDVAPSAKASIQISNVNEDEVWSWLTKVDPLFTREMPPTESAIRFYSYWIGKYMENHGEPKFQELYAVLADASSSTGGKETDHLLFHVVKRRTVKQTR